MKFSALKYLVASVSLCAAAAIASPLYAADKTAAAAPAAAKPATAAKPASTDMQILKDKIKADKKLVVAANLELTEDEAKVFWPIYDAYQKDLGAINKRIGDAVKHYADAYNAGVVPDDVAHKLLDESISIDMAEAQLRKTYADKVIKALPTWKGTRYLQIESKIRAVIRYELASQIPLVD